MPHSSAGLFMAGSDTYLLSQSRQCRRDRTARERSSSRCRSSRHQCSRRHSSRQHLYGPVPAAHHPIPPDTSGNFPAFPRRQNTGGAGGRSRRELPRRQPCPVCIFHRSVHAHAAVPATSGTAAATGFILTTPCLPFCAAPRYAHGAV